MGLLYLLCAVVGCTLSLIQTIMTVFGLGIGDGDFAGGDHIDVAHGGAHDSSFIFGMISVRSLTAATAFFGLSGLAAAAAGIKPLATFALACMAAFSAMAAVAFMMRMIGRLRADGTVQINNTIGLNASVYLAIPPKDEGMGKITITVQNRTMEFSAVNTANTPMPTGSIVRVKALVGANVLQVEPLDPKEEN